MPEKGRIPSSSPDKSGKGASQSEDPQGGDPDGSAGAGYLPSQDRGASGEAQSPASGGTGSGPSQQGLSVSTGTLQARIREAIESGGLDDLPEGFGKENGDWRIATSDDPFERLYLDRRLLEKITSEMVKEHYDLIRGFWDEKIGFLDTGSGAQSRQIRNNYGGPHNAGEIVREHREKTEQAYQKLKRPESRKRCYRKLEEKRRERGYEEIRPLLRQSLRDNVLKPEEVEGLFKQGRRTDLRGEEIADFILDELKERGYEPVGQPRGRSPADRLRSTRWAAPERRQALKKSREPESRRTPQEEPTSAAETERKKAGTQAGETAEKAATSEGLSAGTWTLLALGAVVAAFLLYPAEEKTSSQALPEPKFSVATTPERLNVRAGPSVSGAALTQVPEGTKLGVIGSDGNWFEVIVGTNEGQQRGWIHSKYARRAQKSGTDATASEGTPTGQSEGQEGPSPSSSERSASSDTETGREKTSEQTGAESDPSGETSSGIEVLSVRAPEGLGVGEQATFRAKVSKQGGASPTYRWAFGDGTTEEGKRATHTYDRAGKYTVRFEVLGQANVQAQSRTVAVQERVPTSLSFGPGASATASMDGNRFTVTVVSGTVTREGTKTRVELRVRQRSENFDGKWVRWGHILNESHLAGPQGRIYDVAQGESASLGSGRVRPGDTRTGRVVFYPDVAPSEFDQGTLHFTYFPYQESRAVEIPFSTR
jgi:uncharacterized protein YraI